MKGFYVFIGKNNEDIPQGSIVKVSNFNDGLYCDAEYNGSVSSVFVGALRKDLKYLKPYTAGGVDSPLMEKGGNMIRCSECKKYIVSETKYMDWLKLFHFITFLQSEKQIEETTFLEMQDALMTMKDWAFQDNND